jgi:hypothetical protein
MKQRLDTEFDEFYNTCLKELKARPNFTDAFLPILERYVTITVALQKLNSDIVDEEFTVDHTNKAKATNKATSPAWRMFLMLNREANALAKQLELSPDNAPASGLKKKKGFDLGEMKVTKTA